jgi:hypothetical protein
LKPRPDWPANGERGIKRFDLFPSDNPTYLKQHESLVNGMRKAGLPEG